MKADYPLCFINSLVNEFQKGKECGDESFIIPTSLFEIAKAFIFIEIPDCELNEIKSKHFLKKFCKFTSNSLHHYGGQLKAAVKKEVGKKIDCKI